MVLMAERLGVRAAPRVGAREFGAWMTSEQKRIFVLCLHLLQDREEADSAAQDTFLKAFQALTRTDAALLDDPAKWVTRIAVNTCLDRLRSRKWRIWRRRPNPDDEALILSRAVSLQPAADSEVFAGEIQMRLARALDKLSPRQRAVFTLRHYEDRSLDEIADLLALDVGTVKVHLFRTIRKLRTELRDLYFGANS